MLLQKDKEVSRIIFGKTRNEVFLREHFTLTLRWRMNAKTSKVFLQEHCGKLA